MRYPLSIRFIHWTTALIILGLIALGWFMTPYEIENPEYSEALYFWHKSFGILAFIFVMVRIFNRRKHRLPELPSGMARYEKAVATFAHKALYVLMIAVPLLGYVQSSAYEYSSGIHFFGLNLPELFEDSKDLFETVNLLHKTLAYTLLALIGGHVSGAIKHRLIDRENDVLERIL